MYMAHFKIHCNIKKARTSPSPALVTLNHSTGTHIYTAAYLLINQCAFCRFFFLLALTYGLRGDSEHATVIWQDTMAAAFYS